MVIFHGDVSPYQRVNLHNDSALVKWLFFRVNLVAQLHSVSFPVVLPQTVQCEWNHPDHITFVKSMSIYIIAYLYTT